jgi:hypothetical protein
MLDLIYIVGIASFFFVMAAYAMACDTLGHREESGSAGDP